MESKLPGNVQGGCAGLDSRADGLWTEVSDNYNVIGGNRQMMLIQGCIPGLGREQPGVESLPAVAGIFSGIWRDIGQEPSLAVGWGPSVGGTGQAQGRHLRGADGSGGTWLGETPSIGHLLPISTPGRQGML